MATTDSIRCNTAQWLSLIHPALAIGIW